MIDQDYARRARKLVDQGQAPAVLAQLLQVSKERATQALEVNTAMRAQLDGMLAGQHNGLVQYCHANRAIERANFEHHLTACATKRARVRPRRSLVLQCSEWAGRNAPPAASVTHASLCKWYKSLTNDAS